MLPTTSEATATYSCAGNLNITRASIFTYGETVHSFISHNDYDGPFLPGFVESKIEGNNVGLKFIDHIVGNVELGKME